MNADMSECILFDFDGVIIESMPVRDAGFAETLQDFDDAHVAAFMQFHHENGGLSRYVKFRHLYKNILGQDVSEERIQELADRFSRIMRRRLTDKALLISETVHCIETYSDQLPLYIASGSDQEELRYLCGELDIAQHFVGIFGSPTPKTALVAHILTEYGHDRERAIFIGDSVNDRDAALANGVTFCGYNNDSLRDGPGYYLESFSNFENMLKSA